MKKPCRWRWTQLDMFAVGPGPDGGTERLVREPRPQVRSAKEGCGGDAQAIPRDELETFVGPARGA